MRARKLLIVVLILASLLIMLAPSTAGAVTGVFQSPLPTPVVAALTVGSVPSSGSARVGSTFTLDVQFAIDVSGVGLNGADVYISYDSALVEPVDADAATAGVQPAAPLDEFFGAAPTVFTNNEVLTPCPAGGSACIHFVLADMTPQTNRTGNVARLHWRGRAIGAAAFNPLRPWMVDTPAPEWPYTVFSNSDGVTIPFTSVSGANVSVLEAAQGSIVGVARRQGVPPLGGPGTLGCTSIQATGTISNVVGTTFFDLTYPPNTPPEAQQAGGFWLRVLADTYTVRASYSGYLPSQLTGVVVGDNALVNVGVTRLLGGDVNGDGVINILDIATIIAKFGQSGVAVRSDQFDCGDPDDPADINDDSKINIGDIAIAVGNFGKVGPTPWQP